MDRGFRHLVVGRIVVAPKPVPARVSLACGWRATASRVDAHADFGADVASVGNGGIVSPLRRLCINRPLRPPGGCVCGIVPGHQTRRVEFCDGARLL